MKKCRNTEDLYGNKLSFNDDLVMMFIQGESNFVYCFSLEELKDMIERHIDNFVKKEFKNLILYRFHLFNNIWVNLTSIEFLLNGKVNAIMLVKKANYYEPVKSSRKMIFENEKDNDLSDQLSSSFEVKQEAFHDEGKYRYRKRKINYWDEYVFQNENGEDMVDTKDTGILHYTEWIRYDVNNPGKNIRINYKDEPAYVEYDKEGRKIKEETIYEDEGENMIKCVITFHANGQKEEIWYVNGEIHSGDDFPAVIKYYENGNKESEEWFQNDIHGRDGDLPTVVYYYEDEKKKSEIWLTDEKLNRVSEDGKVILPAAIHYYQNENKASESYYKNGSLYRDDDLPSIVEYYYNGNGKIETETWYDDGYIHRENGPAIISYFKNENKENKNNNKKSEKWYKKGKNYREPKIEPTGEIVYLPSIIHYYKNGNKEEDVWTDEHGNTHRVNGPAIITYFEDDNKENKNDNKHSEVWVYEGVTQNHNKNFPTFIEYHKNGQKKREEWLINNKLHRDPKVEPTGEMIDLPAVIEYNENGEKKKEEWYIDGILLKSKGRNRNNRRRNRR